MNAAEIAAAIGRVAVALWGPPNARLSNPRELRWGTHGSKSVRLDRGLWHDHELGQGGGVLDLLRRELGLEPHEGIAWLRDHGHRLDERLVHQRQSERPVPARDVDRDRRQRDKARWLWRQSRPAVGTVAETYLRQARGITLPLPTTVRFLAPSRPEHHPAMLVPYGLPNEPEPGALAIAEPAITAVQLTLLMPDGSGKADIEPDKITIGSPAGMPMVLAPMNDLFGLAITEGVEDALSAAVSGLGAWAAGGAEFIPKLVPAIERLGAAGPECITIITDPNQAGRRNAQAAAAAFTALALRLGDGRPQFEVRTLEGAP